MVRRHRHLRGADEVHLLTLDPVDVVGRLVQEPGAVHRPRLDHRRRDHLGEAVLTGVLVGKVDQRELELGARAGQEVEPRAGHLGAALDVDGAEHPAQLHVVARLEVELPGRTDGLEDRVVVLPAGRRLVGGQVGDRPESCLPLLLGGGLRRLRVLHLGGELLGLRQQRLLLVALRPLPAAAISLPSRFCSPRLASKVAIASRRAASAARARSTTSPERPRLAWAARTRSGSSRRIRGSIMVARLLVTRDGPHPRSRTPFAILAPATTPTPTPEGIPCSTVRAPRS